MAKKGNDSGSATRARGWMATSRAAGAVIEGLERRTLLSAALLKDINTTTEDSNPQNFASVGSTLYFSATTNVAAGTTGLFKSDGTDAGTVLVSSSAPDGTGPSTSPGIVSAGGRVFFVRGKQLWTSDGTAGGTVAIGPPNQTISVLASAGGRLYFDAPGVDGNGNAAGVELWTSDGTPSGTRQIADINPGAASSNPSGFAQMGGYTYFSATDAAHGNELWRTDGTAAGTTLVADINPGTANGSPGHFVSLNGVLYFAANDGVHGYELWRSDGTAAGTKMVLDIETTGSNSSLPTNFSVVGSIVYFQANTAAYGNEMWRTDGTAAGTYLLKDITAGAASSAPLSPMFDLNGSAYFLSNSTLWKTDGTAAGTTAVTTGTSWGYLTATTAGGVLYWVGYDNGGYNPVVWRTDGTAGGTYAISNTQSNTIIQYYGPIGAAGSNLFVGYGELYDVTPTATQATLVKDLDLRAPYGSSPYYLSRAGSNVFFLASDGTAPGWRLWRSDGTAAGTIPLHDFGTGVGNGIAPYSYPSTALGNVYVFAEGLALWRSDGTVAGTYQIGTFASSVQALTTSGPYVYFAGYDTTNGNELWRTDGTAAGTVLVKDINPGTAQSSPLNITDVNGTAYFEALDPADGYELWKSDGTAAGTVLVKDLTPGTTGSAISNLVNVNGKLYFTTTNSDNTQLLWKSDGTAAGTVQIASAAQVPYIQSLTMSGGKLYFAGSTAALGPELWMLDPATDAVALVKDIAVGQNGSFPATLLDVNGILYFQASDWVHGEQLWRSDGTAAGTFALTNQAWYSYVSYQPTLLLNLTAIGNEVFFIGNQLLWQTDGTALGTQIVPLSSTQPYGMTAVAYPVALGNSLLFAASDGVNGQELWKADTQPQPLANAGGTYSVKEGDSVTLSAAASKAVSGSPIVSYEWDLHPSGTFHTDATGVTATVSNLDGPATYTAVLRITDAAGRVAFDKATITAVNVAPTVSISGPTVTLPEGSSYTINLSAGGDPGPDTISSWRISWGDGTYSTLAGNPTTATHAYGHGTRHYTISAAVTDEDGSYATNDLQVGALDPSFGTGGVSNNAGDRADQRITRLSDGRLVTGGLSGGNFVVARYSASGAIENGFGTAGVVTIPLPAQVTKFANVAEGPGGTIIVAGASQTASDTQWIVARLKADGTADTTFGNNGVCVIDFGSATANDLNDVKVLADGSIVIVGDINNGAATGKDFAVAKLSAGGVLDGAFGSGGIRTIDFAGKDDEAYSVIVLPGSGNILLGGYATNPNGTSNTRMALARLTPSGNLDATFGTGGISDPAWSQVAGNGFAYSMAVDFEGKILLGGDAGPLSALNSAVARYLPNGSFDTSFGNYAGLYKLNELPAPITGLAVDSGGNIVFDGQWNIIQGIRVGRLLHDGSPDTLFSGFYTGDLGVLAVQPPYAAISQGNLVLTPDGHVITIVGTEFGTSLMSVVSEVPEIGIDITNVPPTNASIGPDITVNEGSLVSLTGNYTDPGFADIFTYKWHVTASNGQVIADGTTKNFSFTPTDNGTYGVQFTVTDDMGASASASATVTVLNVAPSVTMAATRTVNEGSTQSFTATVSDPGAAENLTYLWTATLNGTVVAQATTTTFSYKPPDDGAYTITLAVTDKDGGVGSASLALTVLNVPPTISLSGSTLVTLGNSASLSFAATDPGADTISSWKIDWGDGVIDTGVTTSPRTHTYTTPGKYTITASAIDEDGTWPATRTVWVNQAPTIDGNGIVTINGSASDDTISATIVGSVVQVNVNGSTTNFGTSTVKGIVVNLLGGNDAFSLGANITAPLTIDGGSGTDSVSLIGSLSANTANLTPGALSGVAGGVTFSNLEAMSLDLSAGNDSLTVDSAVNLTVTYTGNTGTDSLTLNGTGGNDTVSLTSTSARVNNTTVNFATVENVTINASGGDDVIAVGLDNSATIAATVDAGDGNDSITVTAHAGSSTCTLLGGIGDDALVADFSAITTSSHVPSYSFNGGAGNNSYGVTGTPGNDTLTVDGSAGTSFSSSMLQNVGLTTSATGPAKFRGGTGGSDAVSLTGGAWSLDADTPAGTPTVAVSVAAGATVNFTGDQHLASLALSAGGIAKLSATSRQALTIGALSLSGTGTLDLGAGSLTVSTLNGSAATASAVQALVGQAAGTRRGNGMHPWSGVGGITSSLAQTDGANNNALGYAIGVADASDNAVTKLGLLAGQVTARVAAYGDADLNNVVDIADLSAWNNGFATGNHWAQGDFNYDGSVDIADLSLWNNGFGRSVTPAEVAVGPVASAQADSIGTASPSAPSSTDLPEGESAASVAAPEQAAKGHRHRSARRAARDANRAKQRSRGMPVSSQAHVRSLKAKQPGGA